MFQYNKNNNHYDKDTDYHFIWKSLFHVVLRYTIILYCKVLILLFIINTLQYNLQFYLFQSIYIHRAAHTEPTLCDFYWHSNFPYTHSCFLINWILLTCSLSFILPFWCDILCHTWNLFYIFSYNPSLHNHLFSACYPFLLHYNPHTTILQQTI